MADQEHPRKLTVSRTVSDKLKLLHDLRNLYRSNLHEAERATGVERKLWRYWLKQENTWLDMDHNKQKRQRFEGGGRKMLHPKLDAAMLEWFTEERRHKRDVTFWKFRQQALNVVAPELDIDLKLFKCSNRYIRAFMRRNKLSVRMVTHVAQSLPDQVPNVDDVEVLDDNDKVIIEADPAKEGDGETKKVKIKEEVLN